MRQGLVLIATLIGIGALAGCCAIQPPAVEDGAPVFASMSAAIDSARELYPDEAAKLSQAASSAESAYEAGDFEATVMHLSTVMHGFSGDLDDRAAFKLGVAIALEKDLHAQVSRGKKRVTTENNLNFKCAGGGSFDCVVERGCYCNKLFLDGKLVGCGGGKFPGTPPGTC